MKFFSKKKLAAALLTGALTFGTMNVEAASNFFEEVPAGDWSYSAANELIGTGKIPSYTQQIPSNRVLSRMEMAMIVDEAQKNSSSFSASQRQTLDRLAQEYYYDIKKVQLLNKINMADEQALANLDRPAPSGDGEVLFTTEEAQRIKTLAERFSLNGYAMIRHDHLIGETWTPNPTLGDDGLYHYPGVEGTKTRNSDRHMTQVVLNTRYQINDEWFAGGNVNFRGSTDEVDDSVMGAGEGGTGFSGVDVWVEGKVGGGSGVNVKFGRWNEWTPQGWGYDRDSDISGIQISFGKPVFRTTFTAVQVDLWDNYMSSDYLQNVRGYSTDNETPFVGFRWDWTPSDMFDVHFGVHGMSAMTSRYQDDKLRNHVLYYYVHGTYKPSSWWTFRTGIINSNAKMIDHPWGDDGPQVSKKPGLWLGAWYGNMNPHQPGTFDIYATYRREPGSTWVTVTDWWPKNAQGFRIGADYVISDNIWFNTMVDKIKEIDTKAEQTRYRFQLQFNFK